MEGGGEPGGRVAVRPVVVDPAEGVAGAPVRLQAESAGQLGGGVEPGGPERGGVAARAAATGGLGDRAAPAGDGEFGQAAYAPDGESASMSGPVRSGALGGQTSGGGRCAPWRRS